MSRFITFLILTSIVAAPAKADAVLSRFTQSISKIYTSSEACKDTLSPSPKEYSQLISVYLKELYPNGLNYWVTLPMHPIHDNATCISLLQNYLLEYKSARIDFQKNYPNMQPPPVLVAYNWSYDRPAVQPSRSYQPAFKARVSSKF